MARIVTFMMHTQLLGIMYSAAIIQLILIHHTNIMNIIVERFYT